MPNGFQIQSHLAKKRGALLFHGTFGQPKKKSTCQHYGTRFDNVCYLRSVTYWQDFAVSAVSIRCAGICQHSSSAHTDIRILSPESNISDAISRKSKWNVHGGMRQRVPMHGLPCDCLHHQRTEGPAWGMVYRDRLKSVSQVAWMLQASWGRSDKQLQ